MSPKIDGESSRRRVGLALMELIVSIGVLALLIAIGLSLLSSLHESASRLTCQNNLRQLTVAVQAYHCAKGALPPYVNAVEGQAQGGWFVHLMPFVELDNLFQEIAARDFASAQNGLYAPAIWDPSISERPFPLLRCPSQLAPSVGMTSYLANWYGFTDQTGGAYAAPFSLARMSDGPSNVVLFAEGYASCSGYLRHALNPATFHNFGITPESKPSDDPSYAPDDFTMFQIRPETCDGWRSQSPHLVMHAGFADGAVRSITPRIAEDAWRRLLKPQDGEPVGERSE